MPTPSLSDINNTPLSGLNHIDALLDSGPDWNFLTPVGNVIFYTFSISTGTEIRSGTPVTGLTAFSMSQQLATRSAMAYISQLTGIVFAATADGDAAQVHFSNIDIENANTTGLCSWKASFSHYAGTDELVTYEADAYVYLDNREWWYRNSNLSVGTEGYETLLHELGHMLGLKHPFEDSITLPGEEDNTGYTLMSYQEYGGPYSQFSSYDIAALNWLYGGDGLRGNLGINSATGARFITGSMDGETLEGTQSNDTLQGGKGNDMIYGSGGTDTAIFAGNRSTYTITELGDGSIIVSGADGTDTLSSVEIFQFSDGSFVRGQVVDSTPPPPPAMNITRNANNYVVGDRPFIVGVAEAYAKVDVYSGNTVVASAQADANGFWSATTAPFADGLNYAIYAKAIDASGNVSAASPSLAFNVDAHAPVAPTASVSLAAGSNEPLFSGTGEAGTLLRLVSNGTLVGSTTVASNGTWSVSANPLANASYNVTATSLDKADNATSAATTLAFTVASTVNQVGTGGNDTMLATAGNNNIDGRAGNDTVVFGGARADYEIVKESGGYVVTARSGLDGKDVLLNVETLKFSNATLEVAYDDVVQALYVAYFGRAADTGGLANFQSQLAGLGAPRDFAGLSAAYSTNSGIRALIDSFGASAESGALYSGSTTNFVTAVYKNVFNRDPDAGGLQFWVDAINNSGLSKANASLSIMAGALSNTSTQGKLDAALVNNKTTIASDFSFAIDTAAEVAGYSGNAAAATVRSMLSSVTASTDLAAFQATIKSVLATLSGGATPSGTDEGMAHDMVFPGAIDAGITLVGVHPLAEFGVLA